MSLPFDSVSLLRYVNDSSSVRVEVSVQRGRVMGDDALMFSFSLDLQ